MRGGSVGGGGGFVGGIDVGGCGGGFVGCGGGFVGCGGGFVGCGGGFVGCGGGFVGRGGRFVGCSSGGFDVSGGLPMPPGAATSGLETGTLVSLSPNDASVVGMGVASLVELSNGISASAPNGFRNSPRRLVQMTCQKSRHCILLTGSRLMNRSGCHAAAMKRASSGTPPGTTAAATTNGVAVGAGVLVESVGGTSVGVLDGSRVGVSLGVFVGSGVFVGGRGVHVGRGVLDSMGVSDGSGVNRVKGVGCGSVI